MNIRLLITSFLVFLFITCQAHKASSQHGFFLSFGSGVATESVKMFNLDIDNSFAWQGGLGYQANLNDWFALRFQLNYERAGVETKKYGEPNVVGDRDLLVSTRNFSSTRFMINPVLYVRNNRWQFNFSPGIGIAYCKNYYIDSYYTEKADGEWIPSFSNTFLDFKNPYIGFTPYVSASYQLSKSRKFKSWLELGFQPSFWNQMGDKNGKYVANYKSNMLQLSYTFSFW